MAFGLKRGKKKDRKKDNTIHSHGKIFTGKKLTKRSREIETGYDLLMRKYHDHSSFTNT